ncbi:hypothetical protein [Cochlodiniinecator piscidefendens]|nr:hypothetical protein [Cochlodiniinecator piscidefendens]
MTQNKLRAFYKDENGAVALNWIVMLSASFTAMIAITALLGAI